MPQPQSQPGPWAKTRGTVAVGVFRVCRNVRREQEEEWGLGLTAGSVGTS